MKTVGGVAGPDTETIFVNVVGLTDLGRVRKNNEDNFVIRNLGVPEVELHPPLTKQRLGPRGMLFMVADGMGGEACGEVASQLCVEKVPSRLYDNLKMLEKISETNFVLLIREAIEYANQLIFQKAQSDPAFRGMGSTTTASALFGPYLFIAQVGDSRAYLLRNKKLVQLTRDQTFLNYLAEIGAELPADPEKDSRKSILTQAVGTSETLDVKVTYTKLRQGDTILVCSDGLYNMVKPEEMLAAVNSSKSIEERCKLLIDKANAGGGTDNVTVIMAEFSGPGLPPADSTAAVEFREFNEQDFQSSS